MLLTRQPPVMVADKDHSRLLVLARHAEPQVFAHSMPHEAVCNDIEQRGNKSCIECHAVRTQLNMHGCARTTTPWRGYRG